MKNIFLTAIICLLFSACRKAATTGNTDDFGALKQTVLNDFVDNVAIPQYQGLSEAALNFNNDITVLKEGATEQNLSKAKESWRGLRTVWEQCEGFLFGPVEDDNYDPYMDTWPVDYVQLDSLIASSNPLNISDIQNLSTLSLRGFHPLEYILWGVDGNRTAASITAREKKYIVSLSLDLLNNTTALSNSWITGPGNFGKQQITAAIKSFDAISVSYELAIFNQRTQIRNIMQALETLQTTLEDELKPFIIQYITD